MKQFLTSLLITIAVSILISAIAEGKSRHSYTHNVGRDAVKGSAVLVSETRSLPPFERIISSLAVEMTVDVGKEQSVKITFDDNLIQFITTDVAGKSLIIESEESFSSRGAVRIEITVPKLTAIENEGSGSINVNNIAGAKFRAILSGSGTMELNGRVELADLEINGSGDIDSQMLDAVEVAIAINGSGDAKVFATNAIDAEINGSGNIEYSGSPQTVHSSVNGNGRIRKSR